MKLFKTKDGYASSNNNDFDDITAITNHELAEEHGLGKLSLKNCQAIENGYDLEILASDFMCSGNTIIGGEYSVWIKDAFKQGIQKAMELIEGKKYSRQDVIHALTYGVGESKKNRTHSQILEEYKNSHLIQPKEWEVEIVTKPFTEVDEGFELIPKREPKLDKDGCLILRRIDNKV